MNRKEIEKNYKEYKKKDNFNKIMEKVNLDNIEIKKENIPIKRKNNNILIFILLLIILLLLIFLFIK